MSMISELQFCVDFLASTHPRDWTDADVEIFEAYLRDALRMAGTSRAILEEIVCTEGEDTGLVLKDHSAPTEFDKELNCQVYVHEHFSELGDSLMHLWRTGFETEGNETYQRANAGSTPKVGSRAKANSR